VISLKPWTMEQTGSKIVSLDQGEHDVSYLVYLHNGNEIPQVEIFEDGKTGGLLGVSENPADSVPPGVRVTPVFKIGSGE
jgi:hypothetical protein